MMAFFRRYIFHNFLLKVVSLAIAVLLWLALAHEPSVEVALTVPVEFQHVPDNLEIVTERIPETQIRARGPGNLIRRMTTSDIHAIVDLVNARPGERTYDLTGSQVRVPPEIEVVQVVPAQLHLAFDRQGRKEVAIRPRLAEFHGDASRPMATVDPSTALIIGPNTRVQNTHEVLTDAVDLAGTSLPHTFSGVHIYVADPLVRVSSPSWVTVTVAPSATPARPAHAHPDPDANKPSADVPGTPVPDRN
jgi:hypothetical protein